LPFKNDDSSMRLKHCCVIGRNVQAPSPVVPDTGFPKISGKPLQKWWKSLLKSLLRWDDLGVKPSQNG